LKNGPILLVLFLVKNVSIPRSVLSTERFHPRQKFHRKELVKNFKNYDFIIKSSAQLYVTYYSTVFVKGNLERYFGAVLQYFFLLLEANARLCIKKTAFFSGRVMSLTS